MTSSIADAMLRDLAADVRQRMRVRRKDRVLVGEMLKTSAFLLITLPHLAKFCGDTERLGRLRELAFAVQQALTRFPELVDSRVAAIARDMMHQVDGESK